MADTSLHSKSVPANPEARAALIDLAAKMGEFSRRVSYLTGAIDDAADEILARGVAERAALDNALSFHLISSWPLKSIEV